MDVRFRAQTLHKPHPRAAVAREIVAQPFQPGGHILRTLAVRHKNRASQRGDPTAAAHFRASRPRSVRELRGLQVSGALAKTSRILSFCVTEERANRPARRLNAAWFAGVKAPAAIGVLQSFQKRDEFVASS